MQNFRISDCTGELVLRKTHERTLPTDTACLSRAKKLCWESESSSFGWIFI
jgi:hypothetical protein